MLIQIKMNRIGGVMVKLWV